MIFLEFPRNSCRCTFQELVPGILSFPLEGCLNCSPCCSIQCNGRNFRIFQEGLLTLRLLFLLCRKGLRAAEFQILHNKKEKQTPCSFPSAILHDRLLHSLKALRLEGSAGLQAPLEQVRILPFRKPQIFPLDFFCVRCNPF